MVSFLAKDRNQAMRIAKKRGYYVKSVGLHDNQKGTPRNKKRFTSAKKFR